MLKFLTRARIQLLILVLVLVGMITIAGNISLAVNKKAIDERVLGYFTHNISIGRVFYIFPNQIILKNIIITKDMSSLERSSFALSRIGVRFSLWKLLARGNLHVFDVTVHPGDVNYYALSQFLEDNLQKILEIIRNAPAQDIKIRIKETLLDFNQEGNPDYVATEFQMAVRGDSFEGAGLFRTDQYQFPVQNGGKIQRLAKGWPLWFKLKGQLKPDGFEMDRLIFKSGSHYGKLWGSARSGTLKVNGFMFMAPVKQNSNEFEYSFSRYFKGFSIDNELANINVYILDIDGQANLSFPNIEIEKLNFEVNNIPITLKGDISLLDPFALEVDVSFRQPGYNNNAFFERVDMKLTGEWKDNTFDMNGQMNINLPKNNDLSFSPESAQVTFKGFQYRNANIELEDWDIAYWINDNEHRISLRDINAELITQKEGLKVIEYSASFYEGSLNGKLYIDSTQIPSQMTSQMTLEDVSTDALEELLIHFAKFNGRMSSTVNFTNIPQLDLSGNITLYDGQMTEFNFFNWVSNSFDLPALKAIDFERASAQFSINREHVQLFDIHLKTEDVRIRGYFDVNDQNLVSSKLTIALSQDLLNQSPKFKPVLTIFEEDKAYLNFEFQLSGNIDTMNFQWLPSQVKRKIQERIPDFVERLIEKNINEMMNPDP